MKTNPQINRNVVAGVETLWSLTSNEELWRGDRWVGGWMDGYMDGGQRDTHTGRKADGHARFTQWDSFNGELNLGSHTGQRTIDRWA